jgi:hypothetical protein
MGVGDGGIGLSHPGILFVLVALRILKTGGGEAALPT